MLNLSGRLQSRGGIHCNSCCEKALKFSENFSSLKQFFSSLLPSPQVWPKKIGSKLVSEREKCVGKIGQTLLRIFPRILQSNCKWRREIYQELCSFKRDSKYFLSKVKILFCLITWKLTRIRCQRLWRSFFLPRRTERIFIIAVRILWSFINMGDCCV